MTLAVLLLASAPMRAEDLASAFDRLRAEVGESPDLKKIESALNEAISQLAMAQQDAALARTRMASHTGAILSRELKKVSTSARLVELTRKTGRTEEVARYERRHELLLATIDEIAVEYQSMIEDLCGMQRDLVDQAFAACASRLVDLQAADRIQVHNLVQRHYQGCLSENVSSIDQWKEELEDL